MLLYCSGKRICVEVQDGRDRFAAGSFGDCVREGRTCDTCETRYWPRFGPLAAEDKRKVVMKGLGSMKKVKVKGAYSERGS